MAAWAEAETLVMPAEEPQWKAATTRLAHRIVYGVNRVTAVTPTALTACALLATGKRGIVRKNLLGQAQFLMDRARIVGGRLTGAVCDDKGALDKEAVDRALYLLARDRALEARSGGGSGAFSVEPARPLSQRHIVPQKPHPPL